MHSSIKAALAAQATRPTLTIVSQSPELRTKFEGKTFLAIAGALDAEDVELSSYTNNSGVKLWNLVVTGQKGKKWAFNLSKSLVEMHEKDELTPEYLEECKGYQTTISQIDQATGKPALDAAGNIITVSSFNIGKPQSAREYDSTKSVYASAGEPVMQ